ncbi:MAG: DNA polymerase IV [Bacteroidetes bacterium]|nr:DNA polymerase IV [Bacteroidota bacterium]
MDAFYASIEQIDNPQLKGKPVIVGGTSTRGVVSACSYEARTYGVHSAMPIFQARKLCPEGSFLPVRMSRYLEMSRFIMEILREFSPSIQQISIDEGFLDMTGTELLLGDPKSVAIKLKQKVLEKTGLTISIGIGPSKFIAKMASAHCKPNGLLQIFSGHEILFLDSCKIREIWGIGKKASESLADKGISSVKQLRTFDRDTLCKLFGTSAGSYYYNACRGIDPGIFSDTPKSRSISNETTLQTDESDGMIIRQILFDLSHQVFFRTLTEGIIGKTAYIKIKYADFSSVSSQKTYEQPLLSAEQLFSSVWDLFSLRWNKKPLRLVGVGIGSIENRDTPMQPELFETTYGRKNDLEKAIQSMKASGMHLIKASTLKQQIDKKVKKK